MSACCHFSRAGGWCVPMGSAGVAPRRRRAADATIGIIPLRARQRRRGGPRLRQGVAGAPGARVRASNWDRVPVVVARAVLAGVMCRIGSSSPPHRPHTDDDAPLWERSPRPRRRRRARTRRRRAAPAARAPGVLQRLRSLSSSWRAAGCLLPGRALAVTKLKSLAPVRRLLSRDRIQRGRRTCERHRQTRGVENKSTKKCGCDGAMRSIAPTMKATRGTTRDAEGAGVRRLRTACVAARSSSRAPFVRATQLVSSTETKAHASAPTIAQPHLACASSQQRRPLSIACSRAFFERSSRPLPFGNPIAGARGRARMSHVVAGRRRRRRRRG
jgi:hypothetical protein